MKRGFTLIELLAVILILGIIALIAIPTVNNILKESRRGAFQSTLNNLEKAVEEQCTVEQIKNIDINNTYTITEGKISPNVDIKGDLPDGTIYVDNECKVGFVLFNSNFTGIKNINNETEISDKKLYTENILNGAIPVLSHSLIPVTIDNDGTVKKADIFSKWYSYEEKKWANAVILTDTGKVEDDGTILEDSIESYFVWIPRYKYKLFNLGNYNSVINEKPTTNIAKTIEIVFENKNKPITIGTEVNDYHSHPAFQAFDTNGLWVGKFETSGSLNDLQIKPNKQSLKNLNIKTIFNQSLEYKLENESHMMKNTEWGAVAYLSHSIYGINKKVNNNNSFYTGYSAVVGTNQTGFPGTYGTDPSVTLPYNNETGFLASTTGNINGIYDMSGGANEYLAAYKEDNFTDSGFTSDPISIYGTKYFDKYPNNSTTTSYNNRILGDATGELGPFYSYVDEGTDNTMKYHNNWYGNSSHFLDFNGWIDRGGGFDQGVLAGQFNFSRNTGSQNQYLTFRLVLAN